MKEMIKASRKKGSKSLEEFEEKQNKKFRLELNRERDKLLKEAFSSRKRYKRKRKRKKEYL